MGIRTLREWILWKSGEVSTATNRFATIGELLQFAELVEKSNASTSEASTK